jgi:hypothetical protein
MRGDFSEKPFWPSTLKGSSSDVGFPIASRLIAAAGGNFQLILLK